VIRADGCDMKVMLGVWIAPEDTSANRRELEAAVRLAAVYPDIVVAVCVGNETQVSWSPHRCTPDFLIGYVRQARARAVVPVTVADDFNFWNKPESRTLAAEIDFITMHAHPMWNGQQLDQALTWLRDQTAVVQALHFERTVVLGETGWATSIHAEGEQAGLIKGRPGEAEQRQFYREVRAWASTAQLSVFVFEAFDENWKGGAHPEEVEKHWGLFRADRSPKAAVRPGD
jgi:exo-beta-1,3-glucanase (GH17 family)